MERWFFPRRALCWWLGVLVDSAVYPFVCKSGYTSLLMASATRSVLTKFRPDELTRFDAAIGGVPRSTAIKRLCAQFVAQQREVPDVALEDRGTAPVRRVTRVLHQVPADAVPPPMPGQIDLEEALADG